MNRTHFTAALAVMLLALTATLTGCPAGGDGTNEEEILARAKQLHKEGEQAFSEWRGVGDDDPAARRAAFDKAEKKLQAAADEYTKLYDRHSKDGEVEDGYQYLEDSIQEINQLLHDMTKDNVLGD